MVFCFVGQTCWSSAFRLFQAANMLKHELQHLTFAKQKTLGEGAADKILLQSERAFALEHEGF